MLETHVHLYITVINTANDTSWWENTPDTTDNSESRKVQQWQGGDIRLQLPSIYLATKLLHKMNGEEETEL